MEILPNAEFEIMKVVWANEPPITTNIIMEQLGGEEKMETPNHYYIVITTYKTGFCKNRKRR